MDIICPSLNILNQIICVILIHLFSLIWHYISTLYSTRHELNFSMLGTRHQWVNHIMWLISPCLMQLNQQPLIINSCINKPVWSWIWGRDGDGRKWHGESFLPWYSLYHKKYQNIYKYTLCLIRYAHRFVVFRFVHSLSYKIYTSFCCVLFCTQPVL